ncbi:uncharacterized protein LOC120635871 [Pararge aegeria]|uniref:uncharacterized protein LOC120635871 n=1 Tax=Pararge aegeria TaxID=116150 RepID=UPI0019D277F8|nr:uncharacterized protein LOC120635871 [Pararge aegeria]
MSSTINIDDLCSLDLSLICRGCLATSGEMKNMVEWGLLDDFHRLTNVQVNTSDNPSLLLCLKCEDVLYRCRCFKVTSQVSDQMLKSAIEKKQSKESLERTTAPKSEEASNSQDNLIHSELTSKSVIMKITAPNMDRKINLPCHYCQSNFLKKTDLVHHLLKQHKVAKDFAVDLKFYCHIQDCSYYINSGKEKFFTGRKYLNQHAFKVHGEKVNCSVCELSFANDVAYKRHLRTCNYLYMCQVCDVQYNTNEKLLIHLLRKHPDLHEQYKNERKAQKRRSENCVDTKKIKNDRSQDGDKGDAFCDSPKRSFATQTLELERHIKNDVTLPSWHAERMDETKKDEMSTQTVFEDLLSLKSNMSEDDAMFSDSVSLSDIQTQTLPLEFGLSRVNKETITSETQSPDLSIKETQTCLCLYESPKPNFRCIDSVSSSPSTFSMLTSTETQTLDLRGSLYNDLLSFSSAETQTCFDDDSSKDS